MFLNETGTIAVILAAGTQNLTGSMVATLFLILAFCLAISLMFGIPLEVFAIIILPLNLSMAAYYSSFITPLIVILIYLSMIIAKNWLFR